MPSRLEVLYREALRRRLVQTAALYVAIAWGGTEILVFLSDSLSGESIAGEVRRYLAILLIAGFPAAMYLAWTRDLGLQARRMVGAGAVVVLVAAVLVASIPEPPGPVGGPAGDNTLAVIPFEVCENRTSDRHFASGLSSEVFRRLAQRDYVKVVGRISVQTVLESSPSDATIARLLDVKHLLKGVVCRNGLDLEIHAELVDERGFVVWEQNYEQVVNQADQVEMHLAKLVDNGVASQLGDVVVASDDLAVDRRAYRQLLIGYGLWDDGDRENARVAFEKALEYQSDYAAAVYALARFEDYRVEIKPIIERAHRLALEALERNPHDYKATVTAARIEYGLGLFKDMAYRDIESIGEEEVLASQSRSQSHYAESERLARAALTANPADTEVRLGLASMMGRQGVARRKETLELLEQGLDDEPFHRRLAQMLAFRLAEYGRLQEAMDVIDRFNALPDGKKRLWWVQLEILQNHGLNSDGRNDEKLACLVDLAKSDPNHLKNDPALSHLWWNVAGIAWLGLHDEAARLHAIVGKIPNPEDTWWWNWARETFLVSFYESATVGFGADNAAENGVSEECAGKTNEEVLNQWSLLGLGCTYEYLMAGDEDRARELLEAFQYEPPSPGIWAEREFDNEMKLGRFYLFLGMHDDAEDIFRGISDRLEWHFEVGVRHPHTLGLLAEARYRTGDTKGAVEMLHRAIDEGAYDVPFCCADYLSAEIRKFNESSSGYLAFDSGYWADDLAGNSDVELARSRMRAIVDNQRTYILALLEQNDVEELLAPLIDNEAAD